MSKQDDDDLLLCLESSLRNALATFGASSPQYRSIKSMVDEQAAKIALRRLSLRDGGGEGVGRVIELALRPKGA